MKIRVWQQPDGTLRITRYTTDSPHAQSQADDELFRSRAVHPQSRAFDLSVESRERFTTRKFRQGWRLDAAGSIIADIALVRAQLRDEIRVARDLRLAESDGWLLRAQALGQSTAELDAYRQQLRDLPETEDKVLVVLADEAEALRYQTAWPTPPDVHG